MPSKTRVQVDLTAGASAQLIAMAHTKGVSPSQMAKSLLESTLSAMNVTIGAQPQAELKLMKFVEDFVTECRFADAWDEHVTLMVFDHIRQNASHLHAEAVADGNLVRVHRAIGRMVRKVLGAETRYGATGLNAVTLPRGANHLISSYTLLYRPAA